MGRSFKEWWNHMFRTGKADRTDMESFCSELETMQAELHIRELAFWSCVDLIGRAISKCEFKTYIGKKEVQDEQYWLWNYEPNRNQSASAFRQKLIAKLLGSANGECLVVEIDKKLFVCDSFQRDPNVIYGDRFRDVIIDGKEFYRGFSYDEVLYLKIDHPSARNLVNGLYGTYQKLITTAMSGYKKSRGARGIFKYDAVPVGVEDAEAFANIMKKTFKDFYTSENAVIPLGKGQEFEDLMGKTAIYETTRDVRALVDDVLDFTARSLLIPPALMNGTVQETSVAMDQLLTLCIDPIARWLEEEINRKKYGYTGFSKGHFLKVDTKTIKHIDLLSAAANIERLISSGPFSINDIRKQIGEVEIQEPWADEHFMTKNFATIQEVMQSISEEGGEEK